MKINYKQKRSFKQLSSSDQTKTYSLSSILFEPKVCQDFFIHQEILKPGNSASAPHFHKETDEVIYVLKGEIEAYYNDTHYTLHEGDSICFGKNDTSPHYIKNNSSKEVELLVIKKNINDVVYSN